MTQMNLNNFNRKILQGCKILMGTENLMWTDQNYSNFKSPCQILWQTANGSLNTKTNKNKKTVDATMC